MKNLTKALEKLDIAMLLRIGMGLVFLIGGTSKLSKLLSADKAQGMVDKYMGNMGYINGFFHDYLFSGAIGDVLTPWGFLTALSAFEFVSGAMLIAGLLVRPLALIYALLVWTFVIALPVATTPGMENTAAIHSPAIFVQIRDIALSGLLFTMLLLGSGRYSLDGCLFGESKAEKKYISNEAAQLMIRISVALPLLVGGFFFGMDHIPTFKADAFILAATGLAVLFGIAPRVAGAVVAAIALWYMANKLNMDKGVIGNLNGFKREFAILAGGIALMAYSVKTYGMKHLCAVCCGGKVK